MTHPAATADAVVLGAGCAGLAAAVRLAEAGARVVVLEQGPRLGGRASAFTDAATGERVDNGQHVLFGCYRQTYEFLRRIGTDSLAPLQSRLSLTMADARGHRHQLRCPDLPPPWHLLTGVLRWSALPLVDRVRALRIGPTIQRARRHGAEATAERLSQGQTVDAWLASIGQSKHLCDWLWHPLTLAALNQSPDVAAAAPFVRVVAELFGRDPKAAAIGLSRVPLDELYAEPARRFVEARGGAVFLREAGVVEHDGTDGVVGVRTSRGVINTRHVVSAVPWFAFRALWNDDVPSHLAGIVANADRMGSSPIVTINLWLDGPALDVPFMGLVDGPVHWVFDKARICEAGASHLALVTSGADVLAASDNTEVTTQAFGHLCAAVPEAARRRIVRSVVVRERRATFSLAPGGPPRPSTRTSLPGFVLAGDWTDTGLPATIEGAVLSGHRAADAILAEAPALGRR